MKKVKELISFADDYLNTDNRKLKEKVKCIRHVLKKLKKRESKLDIKFEEGIGNKEKISKELALIHAQRQKGIDLLKKYKATMKKNKSDGEKEEK